MNDLINNIVFFGCLNDKEILDQRIGLHNTLSTPLKFKSKGNLINRSITRNKDRLLSLFGDHAGECLLAVSNPSDIC